MEVDLERLSGERKETEETVRKGTELLADQACIRERQEQLKEEENCYQMEEARWKAAREAADRGQAAFLQNQAGLLARGLAEGLPCPVCGSRSHPAPAECTEEAVSQAENERLQAQAEQQYRYCVALANQLSELRGQVTTEEGRFQRETEQLLGKENRGKTLEEYCLAQKMTLDRAGTGVPYCGRTVPGESSGHSQRTAAPGRGREAVGRVGFTASGTGGRQGNVADPDCVV